MSNGHQKWLIIIAALMIIAGQHFLKAEEKLDSVKKAKEILQDARVKADKKEIEITVRSVDISEFPTITIMIEAYNKLGEPLDTLVADNLFVYENGVQKKIIKVEKIPIAEKVPVDFVFILDKTGSMQQSINNIRKHISSFTRTLISRGIDYRLGLVIFGDDLEKVYDPTETVAEFLHWMSTVKARGGGDEKENALEALEAATNLKYRPAANKVAVLITDAPYHQKGEDGFGVTNQTTETIIEELQLSEVRVFSIVPPKLVNYKLISSKTRGNFYDIDYPFSTILDNFSNQITNLYNLTYTSDQESIPDSIEIALFSGEPRKLVKKTIPIVELGRKLIIENLLFETGSARLPEKIRELDILADFMLARPNVAIIVEGHTDNVGSFGLNDRLSMDRANSVKDYLVSRGIAGIRIRTKGYGERRPIASNNDEFGRKLNRRTEIIIVAR